jgi:predicted TIM-barrel fold metal-dependent hydrolase
MQKFENGPDSSMIYFVAYNPYRDHWNGGQPGDALNIVRSGIESKGAWGVKVYPPSGYRPAGNAIKPRPRTFLTSAPGREWDARYAGLGSNPNTELDHRLDELLTWCIANDVPVLVHCGTGEFEARKGYGLYHSDPKYWRQFLDAHSRPGAPCKLRLCLGHAGGADFWFGGTEHPEWGQEVYDMCRTFPNVYCEITTHTELAATNDPTRRAYFVDRVAKCFDEPTSARYPYPFSKKLMYGTDWYLPDAEDRLDILLGTETAFLHPKLRSHYHDYFLGNALRFLNVKSRLQHSPYPMSNAVRTRLEAALQNE